MRQGKDSRGYARRHRSDLADRHFREVWVDQPADQERPPEQLFDQGYKQYEAREANDDEWPFPGGGERGRVEPGSRSQEMKRRIIGIKTDPKREYHNAGH